MAIELKAPTFPESVADGTVATWHKQPGDAVKRDELVVDIETDKVVMEVLAEADGVMGEIIKNEGDTVLSGEVLGVLKDGEKAAPPRASRPPLPPLTRMSRIALPSPCCHRQRANWPKRTTLRQPASQVPVKMVG